MRKFILNKTNGGNMKFKTMMLLMSCLIPTASFAKSLLSCSSPGSNNFSFEISNDRNDVSPPSYLAKLKAGFWEDSQEYKVKVAPQKNLLNFSEYWNSKDLWLVLGEYHGVGSYQGTLYLQQSEPNEVKFQVKCDLKSDLNFHSVCDSSGYDQNLFFDAINRRNSNLIGEALACGVDVNATDARGCTPLLLLADPDCGTGKFDIFAAGDIKEPVGWLLKADAFVFSQDPVTEENILHKLTRYQDLASVKQVLATEPNVDAQDKLGITPLMRAVETHYLKMVETLILAGADLTIKNRAGETALDIAKSRGYQDISLALSIVKNVVVAADASGKCTPMSIELTVDKPNKIIFKTAKSMVMLDSKDLGISLMAMAGTDASATFVPKTKGTFKMTCGTSMSGGNPSGVITVR
jgi:uncharacterized protein